MVLCVLEVWQCNETRWIGESNLWLSAVLQMLHPKKKFAYPSSYHNCDGRFLFYCTRGTTCFVHAYFKMESPNLCLNIIRLTDFYHVCDSTLSQTLAKELNEKVSTLIKYYHSDFPDKNALQRVVSRTIRKYSENSKTQSKTM